MQCHRSFSFSIKALKPISLILSRFSIMLIVYFVLYRLSNCFNRLQGYFSHSKQNLDWLSLIISQFLIMHFMQEADLLVFSPWQPGHFLSFLRCARQTPQFIPHGAISLTSAEISHAPFGANTKCNIKYIRMKWQTSRSMCSN